MRKNIISALLVLLLLAACQAAPQTGTDTQPGTEAESAQPPAGQAEQPAADALPTALLLDPANADEDSQEVNANIYETLVALAVDEATVSDDGLSYTFRLTQDVAFHDGTPFNADAVVSNFNRWYDPQDALRGVGEFAAWKAAFNGFKGELDDEGKAICLFDGVEKVDDYTVLVHLNRPDPDFLTKINNIAFGIASPAALSKDSSNYGTVKGSTAGTGPYKLGAWTDQGLTLEPNPVYRGDIPTQAIEFK